MQEREMGIEEIGGLLHVPGADFVFGKYVKIGAHTEMIFQRAIEDGYSAGVQAHAEHFLQTDDGEIKALTDKEFTALIDTRIPHHLAPIDADMWRAYFIVGWTCVTLCIVPLDENDSP